LVSLAEGAIERAMGGFLFGMGYRMSTRRMGLPPFLLR
jgi:hypothetical protein